MNGGCTQFGMDVSRFLLCMFVPLCYTLNMAWRDDEPMIGHPKGIRVDASENNVAPSLEILCPKWHEKLKRGLLPVSDFFHPQLPIKPVLYPETK